MAWVLVQSPGAANIGGSATSGSLAFGSNVTAGNLLVAGFVAQVTGNFAPIAAANITDTVGSSYQLGVWQTNGANRKSTTGLYFAIANGSGANTVSFTGSPVGIQFEFVAEFSGLPAGVILDAAATGDFASSASINQPSITIDLASSLLLYLIDSASATITVTSPWTLASTAGFGDRLAYYIPAAAGTFTPAGTQTAATYAISVLALAPAPIIEPGRDFAAGSRFGPF